MLRTIIFAACAAMAVTAARACESSAQIHYDRQGAYFIACDADGAWKYRGDETNDLTHPRAHEKERDRDND
jgi:hypothetical protein